MSKYKSILDKFADKENSREWATKPFQVEDKTCATDFHVMIAVPKFGSYEDMTTKTKGIYPLSHNCEHAISVQELKDAMAKFPKYSELEETECEACEGNGEVYYKFRYEGHTHDLEGDCPICNGNGYIKGDPTGNKIFKIGYYFKIGNSLFTPMVVEKLLFAAETLKQETIVIVYQAQANRASLFAISDAEILLMPSVSDGPKILHTIEV